MNLNRGNNTNRHGILVSKEFLANVKRVLTCTFLLNLSVSGSAQHVVSNYVGFASKTNNFHESAYLLNTSYLGLNQKHEFVGGTSRYRNLQKRFSHPNTVYDYYSHLYASLALNDSTHNSAIGILVENYTADVPLFSESSVNTMIATSFFTRKWEIRPSLALSIRHDYLDLPEIYKISPHYFTLFNLEEPSLASNQYMFMLSFSTLFLHKNYTLGLSLKNINQPKIWYINDYYHSNFSLVLNFSHKKSVYTKRKVIEFEPFILLNYQHINGAASSLDPNLKIRWNEFNQFVGGTYWHTSKFVYLFKLGIYPPLLIGITPYKTHINNEWLRIKEFGMGIGRKFAFNTELIYNLTFVSDSHVSAFHIWGLPQSVRYHQLSFKYAFKPKRKRSLKPE